MQSNPQAAGAKPMTLWRGSRESATAWPMGTTRRDITLTVDIDNPEFPGEVVLTVHDRAPPLTIPLDPHAAAELGAALAQAASATAGQRILHPPRASSVAIIRESYGSGHDA